MTNFYQGIIQTDPRFHSTLSVRDINLLEPITRVAVAQIITDAAAQSITLQITETYRSAERQQHLFDQHATQLRTVGVHHYGLACDFCKIVNGKASWDGDWKFLCDLARTHGLVSGGDWGHPELPHTFRDWDHVQRVAVSNQPKLFSGEWYPDDSYRPV